MPALLTRPPSDAEVALQASLRRHLPNLSSLAFSKELCRSLGLNSPSPFFSAILAMVSDPPVTPIERSACRYLLDIPGFYCFLSDPMELDRETMLSICRAMMRVDPRFDIRLVSALSDQDAKRDTFLRALAVLDETSPGGRLTMTLARVARDAEPVVASKVALLLGKRVSNPNWIEAQLNSTDARTRANVLETLWGVKTDQARRWLKAGLGDVNNRAVGNALVGLSQLGDHEVVDHKLRELAHHSDPQFRSSAAWVMGQTGNPLYREALRLALQDDDEGVRIAAERALKVMDETIARNATPTEPAVEAQPEAPKKEPPSRVEIAMQMRLHTANTRRFYRR